MIELVNALNSAGGDYLSKPATKTRNLPMVALLAEDGGFLFRFEKPLFSISDKEKINKWQNLTEQTIIKSTTRKTLKE